MGTGIVVLGMHRSGTSTVAGTLGQAGVHLGETLDSPINLNPRGLHEPPALIFMHEDLLRHNGGSWDAPPREIRWARLHKAVRDLFIESRSGQPIWGFKEPRTLLVLEGWLEALPDLRAVGVFRHPSAVARSLAGRNGFNIGKGLALWLPYNRRLLAFHAELGFPVLEFTADAARMEPALARMAARIVPGAKPAEPFFRSEFYRNTDDDALLTTQTRDALEALRAAADAGLD